MKFKIFGLSLFVSLFAVPTFASIIYFDTNTTLYTLDPSTKVASVVATGFTQARGITIGPDGNIYVADLGALQDPFNLQGPTGVLDKITGSTPTEYAKIGGAYGVVTDGANLLVSTFNGSGNIYTVSGQDTIGGTPANIGGGGNLTDMLIGSNGDLYVGSQGLQGVVEYNFSTLAQTVVLDLTGTAGSPAIPTPRGLAFGADGTLFAAQSAATNGSGSGIYYFNGQTQQVTQLQGAGGVKGLGLNPDDGLLYYADSITGQILSLTVSGGSLATVGSANFSDGDTGAPQELFIVGTPEPGTVVMMLGGLALIGMAYRKRSA